MLDRAEEGLDRLDHIGDTLHIIGFVPGSNDPNSVPEPSYRAVAEKAEIPNALHSLSTSS